MAKRSIIPFLMLNFFLLFPFYSNSAIANEAEDEAKLALIWSQVALPQLNAARYIQGLPALSGNLRADFFTMVRECNNGVKFSCEFLRGFYGEINRNRGMAQTQQFPQLPLPGSPFKGLGDGMISMPNLPSDDYEAIGIHGERTTRANRDAQIRRVTPNYGYGSGK